MRRKTVLEVNILRKTYGDTVAVEDVSFTVERGEIFGLLGPNGAGKTTTISCICGLLKPDGGTIIVNGADAVKGIQSAKSMLGMVPQELALYEELPVETNLEVFGSLYPSMSSKKIRSSVERCLSFVDLQKHRKRAVKELSGGMKRRLNIAVALMHDPPLVLADEPTAGVDPQSRNHIFDKVEELARNGKGVVYTTHYMEEVERLCRRAAIVDHGQIVAAGTLKELLSFAEDTRSLHLEIAGSETPSIDSGDLDDFRKEFNPVRCESAGTELELSFKGELPIAEIMSWLKEKNVKVAGIETSRPTLEDAFLRLTGRSLRDG